MQLLVDAGNSRLKWAGLEADEFTYKGGFSYSDQPELEQFSSAWSGLPKPDRVLLSSVAGDALADILRGWVKRTWQLDIETVVAPREAFGVVNAYANPDSLGADRWTALVAVRHEHKGAACVVDCGTALTIDALATDGEHLGGLILPGLRMMQRAIHDYTNIRLPEDTGGFEKVSLLARDTHGGIQGGALYAIVALLDRVVDDLRSELGADMLCVVTGGDAARVLPLLADEYYHVPDLVLKGLAIIATGADTETPR